MISMRLKVIRPTLGFSMLGSKNVTWSLKSSWAKLKIISSGIIISSGNFQPWIRERLSRYWVVVQDNFESFHLQVCRLQRLPCLFFQAPLYVFPVAYHFECSLPTRLARTSIKWTIAKRMLTSKNKLKNASKRPNVTALGKFNFLFWHHLLQQFRCYPSGGAQTFSWIAITTIRINCLRLAKSVNLQTHFLIAGSFILTGRTTKFSIFTSLWTWAFWWRSFKPFAACSATSRKSAGLCWSPSNVLLLRINSSKLPWNNSQAIALWLLKIIRF